MKITLFIGPGWNPFADDLEDDEDEGYDEGEDDGGDTDGLDVPASIDRLRERFVRSVRNEFPDDVEIVVAPPHPTEPYLLDCDVDEADWDRIDEILPAGIGMPTDFDFQMGVTETVQACLDEAIADGASWRVPAAS